MACRGIDRFCMARSRTIAATIIRRAEMRAPLQHLARNPDQGQAGIVALVLAGAARILRHAARLRRVSRMPRAVPVAGPFPDIPDHVVNAKAVWRKSGDRRGP